MIVMKEWPILQATAKTGKTKYWVIRALHNYNAEGIIETEWWQEGSVHQTAQKATTGKNIGKSNETNSREQALSEAESEFKKQKDKGYFEIGGQCELEFPLPMLAHDYKKRGKSIKFPCYGQPKLDGFRCLYNEEKGFWSRQGKRFDQAVDLSHLKTHGHGMTLDGELILPRPYTFQQTCQAIKKQREETRLLEYHVFDIMETGTFYERATLLGDTFKNSIYEPKVKIVGLVHLLEKEEIDQYLQTYLEQGYEGLILRNFEGQYEVGQRSVDLQKYKEFEDAEFKVVDIIDGVGRESGAAILVCETTEGKTFQVRPRGTYEMRQGMFRERNKHIGTEWTVRYQNLTDDQIPRFPVGIAPREAWDK